MYVYVYVYVYISIEREGDLASACPLLSRPAFACLPVHSSPVPVSSNGYADYHYGQSPYTNIVDFRGFDSSTILILRG